MERITLVWLAIATFIACWLILFFNGSAFIECYDPHILMFSLNLPHLGPIANCLVVTWLLVYLLLLLGPIFLTLIIYGIYVIIFNRPLGHVKYVLWFSWLIFLYFAYFQLTFFSFV